MQCQRYRVGDVSKCFENGCNKVCFVFYGHLALFRGHGLSGGEVVRELHPLLGEGQDDGVRAGDRSDIDEAHVLHPSDSIGGVGVAGYAAVDGGILRILNGCVEFTIHKGKI